jgi:hypothetical protein
MCSSGSWCAQAVKSVKSCPMLCLVDRKGIWEECDSGRVLWEVEDLGRSEQSKTLLPLGRSWTPRVSWE